ncbi:hypothetical protein RvY_05567 [Ramazzottius varieornatus]|uniref:MANSC domain-containing protein n=1 Tax=Ramazzottius varieornatus TaxID=947166 RepID=A0A1D1UZ38_RAMVA|nr:hypothetical protein RvY_05567 [Ramazzottius varieornatus]
MSSMFFRTINMEMASALFCRILLACVWIKDAYAGVYSNAFHSLHLYKRAALRDSGTSQCLEYYNVKKGRVVQVSKSERLGGRMINATTGLSPAECLRRCCDTEHCTVTAYEHQGGKNCYLFACGDADDFRCEFVPYSDYEVAILSIPRREIRKPISAVGRSNMADLLKSLPGSDQTNQEPSSYGHCGRYEFQCRTSRQCIPIYDRCNGVFECPDRSDEEECERYQQEKYQSENQGDEKFQGSTSDRLEDELRQHQLDDDSDQQTLWDRGRNRLPAMSSATPDFWKFRPETTQRPTALPTTLVTTAPPMRSSLSTPSAMTSPRDDAASTTSTALSSQASTGRSLPSRQSNDTSIYFPGWIDFSDASHSIISVLLILAIGFCLGTTLFVIGRWFCKRRPKVTKYRVVDPDAEDFLLSGTYG